jgi:hypothetical protein
MDKTIIFCRSCDNVAKLYGFFKSRLGKDSTEPPRLPDLACFHLVDMFTGGVHILELNKFLVSICSTLQRTQ